MFYALDPLIMGILLTNMLQYCYRKAVATRSGTHWQIYGPVYLVAAANFMMMLQPLFTLFIYVGKVGYPGSKMWKGSKWFPNTPHGIIVYLLKWVGTVCLMTGVVQISQLHVKIRRRWGELRGGGKGAVSSYADTEHVEVQPKSVGG